MQYWLMKSEPDTYSIDDLKSFGVDHWDGIRNYQVRNFFRDQMCQDCFLHQSIFHWGQKRYDRDMPYLLFP